MASGRWRKIGSALSNITVSILIIAAVVLTFFLVQSKITGSEPAVFGHQIYIVMSGSMEPAIHVGSVVAVRPQPAEEIRPGDVITYRGEHSQTLTTHRVDHVDGADGLLFYTKGDANNTVDPAPVKAKQLVGKVAFTIPYAGYLFYYTRTGRGQIIIFAAAALLVIFEMTRVKTKEKRRAKWLRLRRVRRDSPPEADHQSPSPDRDCTLNQKQ